MTKRYYKICLLSIICWAFQFTVVKAQAYNNEWIDYSKTYLKIKVGKEGVYKIDQPVIEQFGVPSTVTGDQLRLYRNGQEVPIYVDNSGSNYVVYFVGHINNGAHDAQLYKTPNDQLHPHRSLFADTSVYFLTYDAVPGGLRYTVENSVPTSPGPALNYVWVTRSLDNMASYFEGENIIPYPYNESYFYHSPEYKRGEGWAEASSWVTAAKSFSFNNIGFVNVGLPAKLDAAITTRALLSSHVLTVRFNNDTIFNKPYGIMDMIRVQEDIDPNKFQTNNTLVFQHIRQYPSDGTNDRFGLSYYRFKFTKNTNFSGTPTSYLNIDASVNSDRTLTITNYTHGNVKPFLFDETNRILYMGQISGTSVNFYYKGTNQEAELYLSNQASVTNVVNLYPRQFQDHRTQAGNFLIITHQKLREPFNGVDQIEAYKQYRSSQEGGMYNVVVADIEELTDQFAYGIELHPIAVKNYIRYVKDKWGQTPKYLYFIGKGVSTAAIRSYRSGGYRYPAVTTYGAPGADPLFGINPSTKQLEIITARLSAVSPEEVYNYLSKLKDYERNLNDTANSNYQNMAWRKQVLHLTGAASASEQSMFINALQRIRPIIEDTAYGAKITTSTKMSTNAVVTVNDSRIDSLINNGVSMITFFGHGSPSGFDYNLKPPNSFNARPKFPLFLAMSCDVARIYDYSVVPTISEESINSVNGGAINYIAAAQSTWTIFHEGYMRALYTSMSKENYGGTSGEHYQYAFNQMLNNYPTHNPNHEWIWTHLGIHILQGDPAIRFHPSKRPDYYVGAEGLTIQPLNVSITTDSIDVQVVAYNLGKSTNDTVEVKIEHLGIDNSVIATKLYKINQLKSTDTHFVRFHVQNDDYAGLNKIRITIDPDNKIDEFNEQNNTYNYNFLINSDNVFPVYPNNFGIVHTAPLELKVTTLDPMKPASNYRFEIDTTELFNSPTKISTIINSKGGVIKWKPNLTMVDSTVYYWRVAYDSLVDNNYNWKTQSFVYLKNGSDGWNQSHYYQYHYNAFDSLYLKNGDTAFKFSQGYTSLRIMNAVTNLPSPYPTYFADNIKVAQDGADIQRLGCVFSGTLQVLVFDPITGKPWKNADPGQPGRFGAAAACNVNMRGIYAFEFNMATYAGRDSARKFLGYIPDGNYVLLKNLTSYNTNVNHYKNVLLSDTLTNGSGVSLYHAMYNLGFDVIDSYTSMKSFFYLTKKNDPTFTPVTRMTSNHIEVIDTVIDLPITNTHGTMYGVTVGPVKSWDKLLWRTSSIDQQDTSDHVSVTVLGVTPNGDIHNLFTTEARDTSLSTIDAHQYPELKLVWRSQDTTDRTAPLLDYWRVMYENIPEAALSPQVAYEMKDTLHQGQTLQMKLGLENLLATPMDSMLIRYSLVHKQSAPKVLLTQKVKPLTAFDTTILQFNMDPKEYVGNNILIVEANPNFDQPEQYLGNNIAYIPFYFVGDDLKPVLDVTFDGVHILDGDIVSPTPYIKIQLRDENKNSPITDTTNIEVYLSELETGQNERKRIYFAHNSELIFTPGTASNNAALVEYRPVFTQDGKYKLSVLGKDNAGNIAGDMMYNVNFEVVLESSVTSLLNYPNPFSTSTAFVFTLTGNQIPSQFKIQIMTITGKVVREITKAELGPLKIGRNITEYKWDGKDEYGQLLGNGVYLYRVVTHIDGEEVKHRETKADKFYKNGFGKMYIMR